MIDGSTVLIVAMWFGWLRSLSTLHRGEHG